MTRQNNKGFTIIELIIATTIFSVILILATTGIITMGRRYYKGVTTARTQETTRSIVDDISKSIQVSGKTNVTTYVPVSPALPYGDPSKASYYQMRAICVGNVRYSYILNTPLAGSQKHVLWMDKMNDGSACVPIPAASFNNDNQPSDSNSSPDPKDKAQSRELLRSNMRLSEFSIQTVGSSLSYQITLKIFYGSDEVISDVRDSDPSNDLCVSNNAGGQFCADSKLETFVKRRL